MTSQEKYPYLNWAKPINPVKEAYKTYISVLCEHDFWEEPNKNWKQCQKCGKTKYKGIDY